MIKTVGVYNHKPSTARIIRNNTAEENNTIFLRWPSYTGL